MRFRGIDANRATMFIDRTYRWVGGSSSGFYSWKTREPCQRQKDDMILLANIRAQFVTSNGTYGAARVHAELCDEGLSFVHHRVARLMRDNGQRAHQKRRFMRTEDSHHDCPVAFNILDQDFVMKALTRSRALTSAMS